MGRFVLNYADQNVSRRQTGKLIARVHFFLRAATTAVLLVLLFDLAYSRVMGVDLLQHFWNAVRH